jgi:hypothetical protein
MSSINCKEDPSSEMIFQILHACPIQSSLAIGRYRQESSIARALLAPASACHPTRNDRKASSFLQFAILVLFSNQIFFHLQRLDLFLDFHQKSHLVLSSNGRNHCSVYRHETFEYLMEIRGRCIHVWYSKFLEFSF